MPRSCNLTFDLLRAAIDSSGRVTVSIRELGQVARLSHTQARRALKRLQGAHLIEMVDPGSGSHPATWKVLWRSFQGPFPQVTGTLAPIRSNTREDLNPKGTPSSTEQQPKPSKRALAWAMAQLRKELGTDYCISGERRRNLCTGIGSSLWRKMKQGEVRAGPELGAVVSDLIAWLRDAHGVGEGLRSWCSWAGWAMQGVIEDRHAERLSREASARLIDRIRREKAEAQGGLSRFLAEAGASSVREYNQKLKPLLAAKAKEKQEREGRELGGPLSQKSVEGAIDTQQELAKAASVLQGLVQAVRGHRTKLDHGTV